MDGDVLLDSTAGVLVLAQARFRVSKPLLRRFEPCVERLRALGFFRQTMTRVVHCGVELLERDQSLEVFVH